MDRITVQLMGPPVVMREEKTIQFPYRKAAGVFYYICVKKNVTREEVTGIFWAEEDDVTAKKYLRDSIYKIRKAVGEDVILGTGNASLSLNPHCHVEIDLDALTRDNITEHYSGDFLAYFYIKNCLEFEQWSEKIRTHYHDLYVEAVHHQIQQALDQKDITELKKLSAHFLHNNIYNEEIYRQVMRVYAKSRQYNLAIKLYTSLKDQLRKDLEEEPDKDTQQLYHKILRLKETMGQDGQGEDFFYGRDEEIYYLTDLLKKFAVDAGQSVVISGEAGVGKTALLNQLRRFLSDDQFFLLRHDCQYAEKQFYLSIWHGIADQIEQFRSVDQSIVGLLSVAAHTHGEEAGNWRGLKSDFIIEAIVALSRRKKVVLLLDDIQWMDSGSLRLVHNILSELGPKRVVMIAAYRDDYETQISRFIIPLSIRSYLEQITLDRFSQEETRGFVEKLHPPSSSDTALLDKIYRDTEGIPLFIVELLHVIRSQGYSERLSIKATNIIRSRLLNVSETERELLRIISLFPSRASVQELQLFYPAGELDVYGLLENMISKKLIKEDSAQSTVYYSFTHQKIREYTHEHQSIGKRRALHQRIASFYEASYQRTKDVSLYPKLVYHFGESGEVFKTYFYQIQYMEKLFYRYDEIFPHNLHEPGWENLSNDVLPDKQMMMDFVREIDALDDNNDHNLLLKMKCHFVLGRHYIHSCEYMNGLFSIHKSLTLATQRGDVAYMLANYKQLVYYGIQISDYALLKKHLALCGEIIHQNPGDAEEIAWYMRVDALLCIKQNDFQKAIQTLLDTITLLEENDSVPKMHAAVCFNYLGNCYLQLGDMEMAYYYFDCAIEVCDKHFVTNGLAIFYSEAAYALFRLGQSDKARLYNRRAIEAFDITHTTWGRVNAEMCRALIEEQTGNREIAREFLWKARRGGEKLGNPNLIQELERTTQRLMLT